MGKHLIKSLKTLNIKKTKNSKKKKKIHFTFKNKMILVLPASHETLIKLQGTNKMLMHIFG